jgi:hypothetical protein
MTAALLLRVSGHRRIPCFLPVRHTNVSATNPTYLCSSPSSILRTARTIAKRLTIMSGVDDVDAQHKDYRRPHNAHNPIPTVKRYREEKQRRQEVYGNADGQSNEPSTRDRLGDAVNVFRHGRDVDPANDGNGPYPSTNKNLPHDEEIADDHAGKTVPTNDQRDAPQDQDDGQEMEDTTEGGLQSTDPRKARKQMKHFEADGAERLVTDPITHLPVKVHDLTGRELKSTAKNPSPPGSDPRTATGTDAINKSNDQLHAESQESQDAHAGVEVLFPPPSFDRTRDEITTVYMHAVTIGVGAAAVALMLINALFWPTRHSTGWTRQLLKIVELSTMAIVSGAIILFMRQWSENKTKNVWDVEVWRAERERGQELAKTQTAESTQWLNSLLASVWPLINPDLFTSISDTLEVGTDNYANVIN